MTDTVNLGLPYIEAAQAQKHVTHNEALRALDRLVHLAVLDRDLAAPPGAPSEGQRWIVAASPTGAWAGHATHVAAWQDGAWQFSVPRTGWLAYVMDEGALLNWNGTAWADAMSALTAWQNLTLLGIGTTADSTNPFSAKLNNALWVARTVAESGTGNLQYKLSKESAAKTLSFLFQDNFSGRAEIGLTGDDDFRIKVSADGSTWLDAIVVDKATGAVTLPNTPGGGGGGGSGILKCVVVTTANVSVASGLEAGDTQDGVVLAAGDVVLLTGQSSAAENGPRVVPASGAAARHADFAIFNSIAGGLFYVMKGSHADTLWQCTSDPGGTLDSNVLEIQEFLGAIDDYGLITGAAGITNDYGSIA